MIEIEENVNDYTTIDQAKYVLKRFEDMGASQGDLEKEAYKLMTDDQYLYDWYLSLKTSALIQKHKQY